MVLRPTRSATSRAGDPFDRWFVPIALGILLVAAALRLPELALNPFHHDEGVNGFFTTNLVRQGMYHYDPANYHGPSLYYFALLSEILFGLTTEAMRLVPVVFGLLLVGLVFLLRRYLGSVAVLVAGALLAVSPGAVYISRYFIHESLLVAASLGAGRRGDRGYLEQRKTRYLIAAAVVRGAVVHDQGDGDHHRRGPADGRGRGTLYSGSGACRRPRLRQRHARAERQVGLRGAPAVGLDQRRRVPTRRAVGTGGRHPGRPGRSRSRSWRGPWPCSLVIYVLLFSSFFTNFPQGLIDSFRLRLLVPAR